MEIVAWNERFLVWNGRNLPVWNMEKSFFISYHALLDSVSEIYRMHKKHKIKFQ